MDDRSTEEWLTLLRSSTSRGTVELHDLLLRVARAEANRRGPRHGITGAELDDLATQAASDATLAVLAKLDTFRGDSRFTTWAFKFAVFEVSVKVNRHAWRRREAFLDDHVWDELPGTLGFTPEDTVAGKELVAGIKLALEQLTDHQRSIFTAIVVQHVPLDELVDRLHSNRNAIYKTMFDARRKVRRFLATNGYLDESETSA